MNIQQTDDDTFIAVDNSPLWSDDKNVIAVMQRENDMTKLAWFASWENALDPLDTLAAEYVARCEAYDRTVCTGPIVNNEIQPATNRERHLITVNAISVMTELTERAQQQLGRGRNELIKAIQRHA